MMVMLRAMLNKYVLICLFLITCSCASEKKEREEGLKVTKPKFESKETKKKTILFFGNSLTAGYGLSIDEAFPALIQQKIDSAQLNYEVINAGLSGETTASGQSRIGWVLKQHVDIMVLELGANDGLRGIPHDETYKNLLSIINKAKKSNPEIKVLISSMEVPPNMGEVYANQFRVVFKKLANEGNVIYIPFILEGVAGDPSLNLPDGIHPTVEGHKIVASNIWQVLKDNL